MKCADPVLCYMNGKGQKVYRHFSLATSIAKRLANQVFDCGKCIFCRKKKAYELASRCVLHASLYKQNCFLTLTYDETKQGYHNDFNYPDIQKFKKKLRQHCSRNYGGKKIDIFNVHEYGKKGKKHWHLVVFNHQFEDRTLFKMPSGIPLFTSKCLSSIWTHGFTTIGDVSEASAMYTAQYIEKDLKNGNRQNSKKSHSKHQGIGRPYFERNYRQILMLGYVPIGGKKLPIPRYFQKLAHKHYAHFYEKDLFFDNQFRKKRYSPFKIGEENKDIADLFSQYELRKKERLQDLESEWNLFIQEHLTDKSTPDFIKSEQNTIYDLKHKQLGDKF